MAAPAGRVEHARVVRTIDAWQCIGCGKLTAERPCIGVCTDRRVELVQAADYAQLAWRVQELERVLALIARTTPKPEALPASWRALQAQARKVLETP